MVLNTAKLGSALYTLGARDTFFYSCTSFPHQSQLAMSVLANNISSPLFLPAEVESAKQAALYETQVMWASAKQVLPEVVIQTAFKDNTLGHPSYMTPEQSGVVGELELRGFMADWFRPDRTIVTGLGMPHDELVELVQEHFESYGERTAGSASASLLAGRTAGQAAGAGKGMGYATVSNVDLPSDYDALSGARARYTGGSYLVEKEDEEFTHLAVAFEAPSVNDPDVVGRMSMPV
jgi:processing peptidase subunit alpha